MVLIESLVASPLRMRIVLTIVRLVVRRISWTGVRHWSKVVVVVGLRERGDGSVHGDGGGRHGLV